MEPYVGEIRIFGGNFAPEGWALCDGSLLPISENDALFSLLGVIYGGDGVTTFAVPDLTGRLPIGQGTAPLTGTSYPIGRMGGAETVTLIEDQLPRHTHTAQADAQPGTSVSPAGTVWAGNSTMNTYSNAAADGQMNAQLLSAAGGSVPHDNMMPYLPVNFIIAKVGIYPTQD